MIVPGIAGMSVMSTTFTALAYEPDLPARARACSSACAARRCRRRPTSAGVAANAVTNAAIQVAIVIVGRASCSSASTGRRTGSRWSSSSRAGVVCFASLGVACSHVIPNFDAAPAYVNIVFLPVIFISGVFYDADNAPALLRDIAEALPLTHLIDGLSGAMVHGEGLSDHLLALLVLGLWTAAGLMLAVRGFSWDARRD